MSTPVQTELHFDHARPPAPVRYGPNRLVVDVREAASLLSCGRTYLYDLIGAGELPVIKLGRLTRVPVVAIQALVERRLDEQRTAGRRGRTA